MFNALLGLLIEYPRGLSPWERICRPGGMSKKPQSLVCPRDCCFTAQRGRLLYRGRPNSVNKV